MNENATGGHIEASGEDPAPSAARKRVESTLRNVHPNDIPGEFERGTWLRISRAGQSSFEGKVGGGADNIGYLEFETRNEPDRNPLEGTGIAELYEVDEPTYKERLSHDPGRARDIVKYQGATLYVAYDAVGNEYLIEKLPPGKTPDEMKG